MTPAEELRGRWTPDRAAEAKEALENWKKSKRLEQVAFGSHNGRLDLRGLAIYTNIGGVSSKKVEAAGVGRDYTFVTLDEPPEFHNVKWRSLDFSFAEVDHLRIFLSEVTDCLFVAASFRDWRSWGVRFIDCDFSQADLQNSNIGGAQYRGKSVEYINCVWREGRLKAASLSDGIYRDCRFQDVHLAKEQITNAQFIGCSFSGRLEEIQFDGRVLDSSVPWNVRPDAMTRCDLTGCVFDDVQFLGVDTRNIALPNQGQRISHIPEVARRALDWAERADISLPEKRFLEMYWRGHDTKLASDAEGWIDPNVFKEHARALVQRSLAAAS